MARPTLDLDAHYTVTGYAGVAFYLRGYHQDWTESTWELDCIEDHADDAHEDSCYVEVEPEQVEDPDMVDAVMVGDDRVHVIDVEDLTLLPEDGFCHGCGQTGCRHEVYV